MSETLAAGAGEARINPHVPFTSEGLAVNYIVNFDLGPTDMSACVQSISTRLRTFCAGIYHVGSDKLLAGVGGDVAILEAYRSEMYKRRFRRTVLEDRQSILLQLPPLAISGLRHNEVVLIPDHQGLTLRITATLNPMGVGSLVLWLDPDAVAPFAFGELMLFRDVEALRTTVDWTAAQLPPTGLQGQLALVDLARAIAMCIRTALADSGEPYSLPSPDLVGADDLGIPSTGSSDLTFYPILSMQYTANPRLDTAGLAAFVKEHLACIRGLAAGDRNWDKKNQRVLASFASTCDFATRDSLQWFVHQNGAVKLFSADFETPVLTSRVLVTFELELILTMKFFLQRLIKTLNSLGGAQPEALKPQALAALRDRELRRLDDYYSLDFLQKDTTADRLARLRRMFNIEELLVVVEKKFMSLNTYLTTDYQMASSRRQRDLTFIFGIMGAGNLVFAILRKAVEDRALALSVFEQVLVTLVAMLITGVVINDVSARGGRK